jgi:hypothetical protein
MRSDDETRRSAARSRINSAQIADGIDYDRHTRGFHPIPQQRMSVMHRGRKKRSCRLAGNLRAGCDLAASGDDLLGAFCR